MSLNYKTYKLPVHCPCTRFVVTGGKQNEKQSKFRIMQLVFQSDVTLPKATITHVRIYNVIAFSCNAGVIYLVMFTHTHGSAAKRYPRNYKPNKIDIYYNAIIGLRKERIALRFRTGHHWHRRRRDSILSLRIEGVAICMNEFAEDNLIGKWRTGCSIY